AFFVAFFNQMSGCNAINYFAPRIFQMAGLGRDSAFLSTFGLGFLQAAATFAGLWLIDRIGRRTLLIVGGVGYVVSLFAAAAFFAVGDGPWAAACIFLFLASHGLGQGTVIWVLISEVFPQRFRAQGQALGASTHWVFAALVALFFPIAAESVPAWSIFAGFGVMMVFHLLWAWFVVPETKGRPLEDIA
ncbi:MAG: MFS transporter, partial [Kiritimatiellae bacterium]|nr:MFS transporter [Kiritimatiellia bacterium]